jgi:hypothetical protein
MGVEEFGSGADGGSGMGVDAFGSGTMGAAWRANTRPAVGKALLVQRGREKRTHEQQPAQRPALRSTPSRAGQAHLGGPDGQSLDSASAKSFPYNEAEEELTIRGNGSSIDGRCQGEDQESKK